MSIDFSINNMSMNTVFILSRRMSEKAMKPKSQAWFSNLPLTKNLPKCLTRPSLIIRYVVIIGGLTQIVQLMPSKHDQQFTDSLETNDVLNSLNFISVFGNSLIVISFLTVYKHICTVYLINTHICRLGADIRGVYGPGDAGPYKASTGQSIAWYW